ncbi:hypothetical protein ABPG77_004218, partial [Micractinium sp. CCAP 211/92]
GQAEHAQAMDTGLEDLLLGAAGAAAAAAAGLTYELAAAFLASLVRRLVGLGRYSAAVVAMSAALQQADLPVPTLQPMSAC